MVAGQFWLETICSFLPPSSATLRRQKGWEGHCLRGFRWGQGSYRSALPNTVSRNSHNRYVNGLITVQICLVPPIIPLVPLRLQVMYGTSISEMLNVQYRMNTAIMQWSSDELYEVGTSSGGMKYCQREGTIQEH